MSRYIDADALIADMQERYCKPCKERKEDYNEVRCRACWVDDAMDEIDGFADNSIDIPQWTPCSDRLPSERGRYLVVYPMLIDKPWVDILWYGKPTFPEKDEPCFYASDDEYGDVEYSDVIAWMPLPKPYGEREDE